VRVNARPSRKDKEIVLATDMVNLASHSIPLPLSKDLET